MGSYAILNKFSPHPWSFHLMFDQHYYADPTSNHRLYCLENATQPVIVSISWPMARKTYLMYLSWKIYSCFWNILINLFQISSRSDSILRCMVLILFSNDVLKLPFFLVILKQQSKVRIFFTILHLNSTNFWLCQEFVQNLIVKFLLLQ